MKVAICDDDLLMCGRIETILYEHCKAGQIHIQCEVFDNGIELLNQIADFNEYQIYILDIGMPGIDGLEIARKIRKNSDYAVIIFITSHHELMQEAFEVLAFNYLVKPFEDERVVQVLLKAIDYVKKRKKEFIFKNGKTTQVIIYEKILYFESQKRKMIIHTKEESYECYASMKNTLKQLDLHQFTQIHASYIVNMERIRTTIAFEIELQTGEHIPISKKFNRRFNEAYREFILKRMEL